MPYPTRVYVLHFIRFMSSIIPFGYALEAFHARDGIAVLERIYDRDVPMKMRSVKGLRYHRYHV